MRTNDVLPLSFIGAEYRLSFQFFGDPYCPGNRPRFSNPECTLAMSIYSLSDPKGSLTNVGALTGDQVKTTGWNKLTFTFSAPAACAGQLCRLTFAGFDEHQFYLVTCVHLEAGGTSHSSSLPMLYADSAYSQLKITSLEGSHAGGARESLHTEGFSEHCLPLGTLLDLLPWRATDCHQLPVAIETSFVLAKCPWSSQLYGQKPLGTLKGVMTNT